MSEIHAIIFDLDDTLYPERTYVFSGFDAVAKAFEDQLGPWQESAARMRQLFDTEHRRKNFDTILKERGQMDDEETVGRMIETYRNHKPSISLFSDAGPALLRLRRTYKLGLITDGPAVMQSAKINALNLRTRFEAIILTDELGPDFAKPHPKPFELIAEQLGVQHQQCVYVADNAAKDFVAPNQLGWTTIQVIRPEGIYRNAVAPLNGNAQQQINTLDSFDEII